jgi:hypothetical protein
MTENENWLRAIAIDVQSWHKFQDLKGQNEIVVKFMSSRFLQILIDPKE